MGLRSPSDDSLVGCLMDLLKLPRQAPVYLIVDALDECPESSAVLSPRVEVLNFMKKLVESEIPNLRICVTSRPEIDIEDVLGPLNFCNVSLHDERGQKQDIAYFNSSQWLPAHFASRNWPNCLDSISRRDRYRNSMRLGAGKIQQTPYYLHAPLYSPLSMVDVVWETSFNSHISLSRSS